MKRKFVWVMAGLVTLSLILASCAPAVTEKKKEKEVTKEEVVTRGEVVAPAEEEMVLNTAGKLVRKPRYGGTMTMSLMNWIYNFDEAFTSAPTVLHPRNLVGESLLTGDWTKGLNGTGETTFSRNAWNLIHMNLWSGGLATSFEIPDKETQIWHIRKGVHFQNIPGVIDGREMTAYDVAFSLERLFFSPSSFQGMSYPRGQGIDSATATDKWTVVVKTPPGLAGYLLHQVASTSKIIAPEVIEKYGNIKDWRQLHGTGPFIITDYVLGSTFTYKRNPNYWEKDPLHPENQLPYVDGVKVFIIPEKSNHMAALRTGKIDWGGGNSIPFTFEDFNSMRQTHPQLKWRRDLKGGTGIAMRVDKPELPWYDLRVRRALSMAIDRQTILKDYYEGDAVILTELVGPIVEFQDIYIPLEKYPEHIRELWEYHPDKARKLLAEAGYPNGFQAEVVLQSKDVDDLSLIKAYWDDIGVDLRLVVKEPGAFAAISGARAHPQMIVSASIPDNPQNMHHYREGSSNTAYLSDPVSNEAFSLAAANFNIDHDAFKKGVQMQLLRGLELSAYVFLPSPYNYTMWWPWLANYNGELSLSAGSHPNFVKYIWIDQDMKKEMTGRR